MLRSCFVCVEELPPSSRKRDATSLEREAWLVRQKGSLPEGAGCELARRLREFVTPVWRGGRS